jgi:hypothetical protein
MIWKVLSVDPQFIQKFSDAGPIDWNVVNAHLNQKRRRPIVPQQNPDVPRWYYLLQDDPATRMGTVGAQLDQFKGHPAKLIIGTVEIIGEFAGQRELIGIKGLKLQLEPIHMLSGEPDAVFKTASLALASLSNQIPNLEQAEKSQRDIQNKYRWKK